MLKTNQHCQYQYQTNKQTMSLSVSNKTNVVSQTLSVSVSNKQTMSLSVSNKTNIVNVSVKQTNNISISVKQTNIQTNNIQTMLLSVLKQKNNVSVSVKQTNKQCYCLFQTNKQCHCQCKQTNNVTNTDSVKHSIGIKQTNKQTYNIQTMLLPMSNKQTLSLSL